MTNQEAIRLIVSTYRFDRQVPADTRAFLMQSARKNLVSILKTHGHCGILVIAAVHLVYLLKKHGLTASLLKTYMGIIAGSAVIAGAITTAAVIAVRSQQPAVKSQSTPAVTAPVAEQPITPPAEEKPLTPLRKLYNKHKHMESVRMKDGSVFAGVIREKDGITYLITPEGTLQISKDDIESIEYLRPEDL